MPQLVPFYFINQVTFAFVLLVIMIYVFANFLLPDTFLDMLKKKSEEKVFFILPILNESFHLLYILFTVLIIPMFFLNTYVFGGFYSLDASIVSYGMLCFILFISFSNIYLIFMVL